ncbi:hypothetical protein [Yersinia phage MHG19]|nr:hypothetical protein [Yersinia phage MHG19]
MFTSIFTVIVFTFMMLIYMIPGLIAFKRGHHNALAIAMTNLVFGWSMIGWGIALIWSLTNPEK